METAKQRANIYRFLSVIYSIEPTPEFVKEITTPPLKDVLSELGVRFDPLFEKKNAASELSFEYVRVFIGTGPKHVPPYESVYRDKRKIGDKEVGRLMWGDSTMAVAQFYEKLQYEPEEKFKDIPDHIGVELGFMEQLCLEEAQSLEESNQEKSRFIKQKELQFLEEHLLQWADNFVNEVCEFTTSSFYSSVAQITGEFLQSEKQFLTEELQKKD